jgi:hypothetical protein
LFACLYLMQKIFFSGSKSMHVFHCLFISVLPFGSNYQEGGLVQLSRGRVGSIIKREGWFNYQEGGLGSY